MYRSIIHADIDAFLASVEQVRDPSLRGRPVVVGGERGERGIVLSSTYEARRYGVRPGLTLGQAEKLLPEAVFLRGDAQIASRLSEKTWAICRRYTPLVMATSIDDCYLDVTGSERLFGPAREIARRIRREVAEEVGFRLSMGIGENRTTARVATVFAKPGGVVEVPRSGVAGSGAAEFLAPLPVRRLPGVGRRTEQALHRYNVKTIGELARIPRGLLERTFGTAAGRLLSNRARGRDDEPVVPRRPPRSVSRETSFDPETADRDVIGGMLFYLLERAAATLRVEGRKAKTVEVKIRYVDGPGEVRRKTLPHPSDQERELHPVARALLNAIFTRRVRLKLLGVALTRLTGGGLTEEEVRQKDLFKEEERVRRRRLSRKIDRIRERFGFRAITAGGSINLMGKYEQGENGFVLKTPSLTK